MEVITEAEDSVSRETITLPSSELLESLEEHDDVVSWINTVLDFDEVDTSSKTGSAAGLSELDRRVTQLVGTLELASEDTSVQVERIIDDISRGASRLTYDLHFMRDGAMSLQMLLREVEVTAKTSLPPGTNAALERLQFLDTVKRNMEAAREVLREAESWSTLESDVISLLGEQNYERAAERLSEASKSMVVFQNTPEYETRRTLMVSLQNQLEASLSSALVAAVNSQDVAVCKNYFSIFCNIQRESEFRNYYYGSRKAPLAELWQNARLRDCDGSSDTTPTQTFAQFLPTFFAAFLAMLSTERTSISAIFPDPQPTLSTLITSTLSSLQPSFSERLSSVAAHHGARVLPQLIAAYQATQEFAVAADKILEKIGYASQPPPPSAELDGTQTKAQLRRRSSARMSISRRMGPRRGSVSSTLSGVVVSMNMSWDQELAEPFVDFQADYASLERRYLSDALRGIFGEDVRPTADRARLLRERSVDVFSAADDAITRCSAFTHGYGLASLVQALESFFKSFVDRSKAEMAMAQTGSISGLSASASGDLSDLDYTSENWATIQSLLHTLEAVRALNDKLLGFENRLRAILLSTSHTFRLSRADPAGMQIPGTTRGTIQVLAQSTLNSMELHDLLERVDPDSNPPPSRAGASDPFLSPPPLAAEGGRRPSQSVHFPINQSVALLLESREGVSSFAKACQVALQDTILSPLRKRLSTYPSLAVWSASGDAKSRRGAGGSALSEVSVPTFSLSPSDTMQRVAEGLLNLPRLFEVYADDDALSFSLETLPFIKAEMLKALSESPAENVPPPGHSRRAPSLSLKTAPVILPMPLPAVALPPEAVSAAWLSSLGLSLLSHLTSTVLPSIRTLSSSGAAQLASDLGYLSSIVMALNIEDPELDKWKEFVEMDDAAGRERLKEDRMSDNVLGTVAKLRGWIAA